jgi:hypothetical protein
MDDRTTCRDEAFPGLPRFWPQAWVEGDEAADLKYSCQTPAAGPFRRLLFLTSLFQNLLMKIVFVHSRCPRLFSRRDGITGVRSTSVTTPAIRTCDLCRRLCGNCRTGCIGLPEFFGSADTLSSKPWIYTRMLVTCRASILNTRRALISAPGDVFLFSPMTPNLTFAIEIAAVVKELYPQCHTIFGGVAATPLADALAINPIVDFVVTGRGEYALPALLDAISSHSPIDNVGNLLIRTDDGRISRSSYTYTSPLLAERNLRSCRTRPSDYIGPEGPRSWWSGRAVRFAPVILCLSALDCSVRPIRRSHHPDGLKLSVSRGL